MLVTQVLNNKGRAVFTVGPDDTVSSVAALLYARKVGAFVVVDSHGRVVGMVSERDIIRAVATMGAEGLLVTVASIMSRDVIFAEINETAGVLLGRMTDRRVRHLPVMDGGALVGILSIGDLVKVRIEAAEYEARSLRDYIVTGSVLSGLCLKSSVDRQYIMCG
jgi:CBS domain-containing protein